ncbi:MAG: hypothetical protein HN929_03525, partial [Chloroflexi bacterium]|nr:hypothetical protein [Chloroflexota bacterium]
NIILTKTNAYVEESTIKSAEDFNLNASGDSTISSTVLSASFAAGGGGAAGVGASVGFSIAKNYIGYDSEGQDAASEVRAYVENSDIITQGSISQTAIANQSISTVVFAGSAAIAGGGAAGVGLSGSGVLAENRIGLDIESYIKGDKTEGVSAADITLLAKDTSAIYSYAGAASIAASFGGAAGVSASIGVALARNSIDTTVEAYIQDIDQGLTATGDIIINAEETAYIKSIAWAASVAAGFGGAAGIAVSGAGAEANNIILGGTQAFIAGSEVQSAGNVDIKALNSSEIQAVILSASLSASAGGAAGVGASIGLGLARNFIGYTPGYDIPYTYTTDDIPTSISKGTKVKILNGIRGGDVYEYIGNKSLRPDSDSDPEKDKYNKESFLSTQDYANKDLWRQLNYSKKLAPVHAYIENTNLETEGDLTLKAEATQSIDAYVFAGSAAISGGGAAGVGLSGAGVSAENKIASSVKAYIGSDEETANISAGSLGLYADDNSSINAVCGAASLAAGLGGAAGVAASIGVSLGFNEIANEVEAFISNANVTTLTGDVDIAAHSNGKYLFDMDLSAADLTTAELEDASVKGGDSGAEVAESKSDDDEGIFDQIGDAVDSDSDEDSDSEKAKADFLGDRDILIKLRQAFADNGKTLAVKDFLSTESTYRSDIKDSDDNNKKVDLVPENTVKVASGHTAGGIAGKVYRYMGEEQDDVDLSTVNYESSDWMEVENLKISTLQQDKEWLLMSADGETFILKTKDDNTIAVYKTNITAISLAASLSAAVGGAAGIAISGAGAVAQNIILTKTNAYVEESTIKSAGDFNLNAASNSMITSTVLSASFAAGAGGAAGVGASIGVAIAENYIGYDSEGEDAAGEVRAYVENSDIIANGSISQTAIAEQTINSVVFAGSAAIAGGGAAGIGLSGSGVLAENRVSLDIESYIKGDNTEGVSAANISLLAQDTTSISSFAGAASIAAGFGGAVGVSLSVGVSLAQNIISNSVNAYIQDIAQGISSTSGDIVIKAEEKADIEAKTWAASLSLAVGGLAGIGVSGAGAEAKNIILTGVKAYVDSSDMQSMGDIIIDAHNSSEIDALIMSASAALGGGALGVGASIGLALARNYIGWDVDAAGDYDYTTNQAPSAIRTGDMVKVLNGVRNGDVYEYIGEDTIRKSKYDDSSEDGAPSEQEIYLSKQDYGDTKLWKQVNLVQIQAPVQAYAKNSSLNAEGQINLNADAVQKIEAIVFSGSAAIAGGGIAAGLSGAGANAVNSISMDVKSFIEGTGENAINGTDISLSASDDSSIDATVFAGSIAASFGAIGGSVSIAVAIADNSIDNIVNAYVDSVVMGTDETPAGNLTVTALEKAEIDSKAQAMSFAASFSIGFALA